MVWPIVFVFPPPASLIVTAMSVIGFPALTYLGFSEMRGKHLQYSKFWNTANSASIPSPQKLRQIYVSGRRGMQILYTPALLAALASFVFFPHHDNIRYLLLSTALTIHFFKRLLEVQFVHKYSGGMALDSAGLISLSYFSATATMIYAQHLNITQGLPEPPMDLKYPGILLFLLGISGNFYHHYLLSKMRSSSSSSSSNSKSDDDKDYKIPKGGLFELVICPHYLFEIIGFVGISCISQSLYAFVFTIGTIFYLTGRSCATRRWYCSKFKQFPHTVKALIPFLL